MNGKKVISTLMARGSVLALVTVGVSGLFKLAAFVREAFIASHFGLSSFTDAYFAFQQFPLTLASFMYGAFALAFTPAYANEKRLSGRVVWLPGLLLFGTSLALVLTAVGIVGAPWIVREVLGSASAGSVQAFVLLACSCAPVIWLGLWAGAALAAGRNIAVAFVTGLPYLLITLLLMGVNTIGRLNNLSLPISFAAAFALVGLYALISLLFVECNWADRNWFRAWRFPEFRRFLRQLAASSLENLGFASNQLLLVFFLAKVGPGAVSANTFAMRIGMLGFALLGLPLAQMVQARLCAYEGKARTRTFKKWALGIGAILLAMAAGLYLLREPIVSLVYLRGKFSTVELTRVLEILPAWIVYFVVVSMNAIVARYLFAAGKGKSYVARQLVAYAAANLARWFFLGRMTAAQVVWCSVVTEGVSCLLNYWSSLRMKDTEETDDPTAPAAPRRAARAAHVRDRMIVVYTPEPGSGAGQYVAEFVSSLAAQGEKVRLICPENFYYKAEVLTSGAEIVSAPARDIEPAPIGRRILRNLAFTLGSIHRFWSSIAPGDIVHFQFTPHPLLAPLYFTAARARGVHLVQTVHDPLPHSWLLPKALRWLELSLVGIGFAFCRKLVVHNESGRRILIERFHVDAKDVAVIPHGPLKVASEDASVSIADGGPLRLLVFGSLRENKAIHLAITATQRLRSAQPARDVTLTIAGRAAYESERVYWEKCKSLMAADPRGIEAIERDIDDAEVGPLFARHDAVLLPYDRFFSDSGVAMLALAQKRPIVATAAGGLGDLFAAVDCGVQIEAANVEAVAAAIERADALPRAWLAEKGLNGYRYAVGQRSWDAIARRTLAFYRSLQRDGGRVVLHTPEPASAPALYVEALAKALAADKVPVAVVCPANHSALRSMLADSAIDVHPSSARGTEPRASLLSKIQQNLGFVLSSVWTLFGAVRRGDIVHLQYIFHLPAGLIFYLCAFARSARVVLTVHDPLPHKFMLPGRLRFVELAALGCAYRWSDALIVHSEAGKAKLMQTFGLPANKIDVIVHGPYRLKQPVTACAETQRLEVLFFGSLRENKAPHLVIQAVKELAAEGVPVRLTLAGQVVNRKEEAYWREWRSKLDLKSESIRLFEGYIGDDDLAGIFSACHCFVLPYTSFSSDSGVAYMALANRKPIVATRAGGLGWLLDESGGGIEIRAATVAEVKVALRSAVTLGGAGLERIGQRGGDWVLTHCGWPKVANETRKTYARWLPRLRQTEAPVEAEIPLRDAVEAAS